jgi:hypothetical protein
MKLDPQGILESVARGEITPEEGNALLKALERPRPPLWRWLLDPIELLSTPVALTLSALGALVGAALSRFGVRFDGALDTHHVPSGVSLTTALLDLLVSWPLVAVLFFAASRVLARQGRLVDFLAAVGLARIPLLLAGVALVFFADHLPRTAEQAMDPSQLLYPIIFAFVFALPCLAWFITLLVRGFRTASGLRGAPLVISFIATLLIAEVLSKLVLAVLA